MPLVQNRTSVAIGSVSQALSNFDRSSKRYERHCQTSNTLELDKAKNRLRIVRSLPRINRRLVITVLQVLLAQTPRTLLTSLHRDLQHLLAVGNDQVVFGLISSILDRYIVSTPGKQSGGNGFGCNGDVKGFWKTPTLAEQPVDSIVGVMHKLSAERGVGATIDPRRALWRDGRPGDRLCRAV